jgi:WD40 repeat protein
MSWNPNPFDPPMLIVGCSESKQLYAEKKHMELSTGKQGFMTSPSMPLAPIGSEERRDLLQIWFDGGENGKYSLLSNFSKLEGKGKDLKYSHGFNEGVSRGSGHILGSDMLGAEGKMGGGSISGSLHLNTSQEENLLREGVHLQTVNDVAWAPLCGRTFHLIATASMDTSIKVWRFQFKPDRNISLQLLSTMLDHKQPVYIKILIFLL